MVYVDHPQEVLSTGCKIIDEAISKVLHPGSVVEVVGESGSGKTQFVIQLCLSVSSSFVFLHIFFFEFQSPSPADTFYLVGTACYICTDSLPIARFHQIATLNQAFSLDRVFLDV